jgi:hypothetical protein
MVAHARNRSGKTHVGCLFALLIVAAGIYVGIHVAEVYFRAYRLQDLVKDQVTFASLLTDDVIRRRLIAYSDTLGVPLGARDWIVRRTWSPKEITISAQYRDTIRIEFLGLRRVFVVEFKPYGRGPL